MFMHFISHQKRLSTCHSQEGGQGGIRRVGQFYVQVLKYSIKSALDGKSPQCAGQEVVKVGEGSVGCPLRSGKSTEVLLPFVIVSMRASRKSRHRILLPETLGSDY